MNINVYFNSSKILIGILRAIYCVLANLVIDGFFKK